MFEIPSSDHIIKKTTIKIDVYSYLWPFYCLDINVIMMLITLVKIQEIIQHIGNALNWYKSHHFPENLIKF